MDFADAHGLERVAQKSGIYIYGKPGVYFINA